jgi:ribosomal-protein-alanine N-acetyltransferase
MTDLFRWEPPTLTTERTLLRPLTEDDAPAVFAYASNPKLTRFTLWETHLTLDDSLAFARDYARSRLFEHVPEPLGLCLRSDPATVIGSVGCFWASRPNATMELGYALGEPHWGRGLVAEASRALLTYVFANYPVERVQARVVRENDASARVLAKLGFTYEGTLRHSLQRRGRAWDVQYYAVLRGEWRG